MTPERWDKIQTLFEEARSLSGEQRMAFVESATTDDPLMRAELERMLNTPSSPSDFLERPFIRLPDVFNGSSTDRSLATGHRLSTGDKLCGRFEIQAFLGAGGMGEVYAGYDHDLSEQVAVKVIRAEYAEDPARIELLRREVRQARRVMHPGVCRVNDFFTHEDSGKRIHFLTMQLLHGRTLSSYIREKGRVPVDEALDILQQIASAVHSAHVAGVVHRDLKSANIFLSENTGGKSVVVTDFGLAMRTNRRTDPNSYSTLDRLPLGTLPYMAPEQMEHGKADERTDVYSIGLIAYELLAGQLPHSGDSALSAVLKRVKAAPPPPGSLVPDVPEHWNDCVTKCLAPRPQDRFQTPVAFTEALTKRRTGLLRRNPFRGSLLRWSAVGLLALVVCAAAAWRVSPPREAIASSKPRSIAVLPFRNASQDASMEYFSDGITEEVINSLAHLEGVRVVGRNSVFRYKRDDVDVKAVAKDLDVDLVMTGSVHKVGNRLTIRADLLHADGKRLWWQRYDREVKDVFTVQDEIASTLSTTLHARISPERQAAAERRTRDIAAFDLYMRARYQAARRDKVGLENAAKLLEEATRKDPDYAIAWAELGNTHLLRADYGFVPSQEVLSAARAALMRSIQIDPGLSDGHAVLGQLYALFDWDFPNAEKAFQHAIELNQNNASAHHWYAQLLSRLGRTNEALAIAHESLRLDPVSVPTNTFLGWLYFYSRQYQRAIDQSNTTLDLNPYFVHAHVLRSQAAAHLHEPDTARAAVTQASSLTNDKVLSGRYTAMTLAIIGDRASAGKMLGEVQKAGGARQSAYFAYISGYLGRRRETFEWLERAFDERDPSLTLVKVHPALDKYRKDPQYLALLQRMKLPVD